MDVKRLSYRGLSRSFRRGVKASSVTFGKAVSAAMIGGVLFFVSGCTTVGRNPSLPDTLASRASNYGYVPLDGLAIDQDFEADSCAEFTAPKGPKSFAPLSQSLPDITVRFAVASYEQSGGLSFGPAKFTAKGKSYRAVLDYVNVDAIPVTFLISAITYGYTKKLSDARGAGMPISGYNVTVVDPNKPTPASATVNGDVVTIPVYIGVGLRLSADVTALESGIPLVSLSAIGFEAQSNSLTGTLTVQAIGLPGETVASSLPLPSKLDQTTIENGVLAIGANRLNIYRYKDTDMGAIPRVVGLYSPIGTEPALINAIYSELSKKRPKWSRPCKASAVSSR
ncbi:hypothetical protein [Pseudomonas sp. stari2]|uniref:hypothetical protein n=1 Tax=Pseudomonas sp. Stari2 TaxID=2954814 RepID=UPI00345D27C2